MPLIELIFKRQPVTVWFLTFGVVACIGISGCSSDPTGLGHLSAVSGEVKFKGEPTPGAIVELVPKGEVSTSNDAPRTFAVVQADGKFELQTVVPEGLKKGAPPGEYLILVSWTKPLDPGDKDSSLGPDLLPPKYKDPKSSLLEFDVEAGKNEIPPLNLEP